VIILSPPSSFGDAGAMNTNVYAKLKAGKSKLERILQKTLRFNNLLALPA
jgi:hypothetical protein